MDREVVHAANVSAWLIDEPMLAKKLDSLLKKNTALIKRLRMVLAESKTTIVNEINQVSLTKYILEVCSALEYSIGRLSKRDDILAVLEVVLALHQRFGGVVTSVVNAGIISAIKEVESKQVAVLVEVVAEFLTAGLFETIGQAERSLLPDGYQKRYAKLERESAIVVVVKDTLLQRFSLGDMLPVVTRLVKRYGSDQFAQLGQGPALTKIVEVYYNAVCDHISTTRNRLVKAKRRNQKAAIGTGRFLPEHVEEVERLESSLKQFSAAAGTISTVMGYELPQVEAEISDDDALPQVEVVKQQDEFVFESAAHRAFYMLIPTINTLAEKGTSANWTAIEVTQWFARLELISADNVDQLAYLLVSGLFNNKATRQRIHKQVLDILSSTLTLTYSLYARLLAIIANDCGDLVPQLVDQLDKGFRTNIKFQHVFLFVELAMFHLVPQHTLFHKIRTLTRNVHIGANIDLLTVFYQQGGRFFYYDAEHGELMKQMVELLKQMHNGSNLSVNEKLAIKALIQVVEPVSTPALAVVEPEPELTDKQQFMSELLGPQLNSTTWGQILNLFAITDASTDPELVPVWLERFSHPELTTYPNLPYLAKLFKIIAPKNRAATVKVIDNLVELIKRGLELNDYRQSRTRMAQVRFLTECSNSQIVGLRFLITVFYKIMTLGHANNQPLPGAEVAIDLPNNFFRLHLVCVGLKALQKLPGAADNSATSHLRSLIVFVQFYALCKQEIPADIRCTYNEVLAKYEDVVRLPPVNSLVEAARLLQQFATERANDDWEEKDDMIDDDDDVEEAEDEEAGDEEVPGYDLASSSDESDDSDSETDDDSDSDDGLEVERVIEDERLAADIDREMRRFVIDLMNQHQRNLGLRRAPLDAPMMSTDMLVKIMTRSGKGNQLRKLDMKLDHELAAAVQKRRDDEEVYKQRILRLAQHQD